MEKVLCNSQYSFSLSESFCLADSNHAGIDKVYYFSRMTKQCIEETLSGIDYQELFPDISYPDNICNMSDDKGYEEDSSSNYYAGFTDNICLVI